MVRSKGKQDRRRRKRDDLPWLVGIGVFGYFILESKYSTGVITLLGFVVLMLWVLFVMPTRCDYDVGGRGCVRGVDGKLNGCHDHGALKRDAIFAAMRMQNPGLMFRVTWSSRPHPCRSVGASLPMGIRDTEKMSDETRAKQGAYNLVMLVFTAMGSIASVLALFI